MACTARGRKAVGSEEFSVKKLSVCVLFGGMSPEHEVSLRSAESVLNHLDKEKYNIFPVGITKTGEWILYGGTDYSDLPNGKWQHCEDNRRVALSPVRGQGLLNFEGDCVVRERIDVVFPVLHGENGEDGSVQGLLQIAGLPYVGSHVAASAACMDKTITKLIASQAGVRQADWQLVTREGFARSRAAVLDAVETDEGFNAIGSCIKKEYIYKIHNSNIRDPFLKDRVCFYPQRLDMEQFSRAAAAFEGTHDFKAVREKMEQLKQ